MSLQSVEELKSQGNTQFANKEYVSAIKSYSLALNELASPGQGVNVESTEGKSLQSTLYSNRAQARLSLSQSQVDGRQSAGSANLTLNECSKLCQNSSEALRDSKLATELSSNVAKHPFRVGAASELWVNAWGSGVEQAHSAWATCPQRNIESTLSFISLIAPQSIANAGSHAIQAITMYRRALSVDKTNASASSSLQRLLQFSKGSSSSSALPSSSPSTPVSSSSSSSSSSTPSRTPFQNPSVWRILLQLPTSSLSSSSSSSTASRTPPASSTFSTSTISSSSASNTTTLSTDIPSTLSLLSVAQHIRISPMIPISIFIALNDAIQLLLTLFTSPSSSSSSSAPSSSLALSDKIDSTSSSHVMTLLGIVSSLLISDILTQYISSLSMSISSIASLMPPSPSPLPPSSPSSTSPLPSSSGLSTSLPHTLATTLQSQPLFASASDLAAALTTSLSPTFTATSNESTLPFPPSSLLHHFHLSLLSALSSSLLTLNHRLHSSPETTATSISLLYSLDQVSLSALSLLSHAAVNVSSRLFTTSSFDSLKLSPSSYSSSSSTGDHAPTAMDSTTPQTPTWVLLQSSSLPARHFVETFAQLYSLSSIPIPAPSSLPSGTSTAILDTITPFFPAPLSSLFPPPRRTHPPPLPPFLSSSSSSPASFSHSLSSHTQHLDPCLTLMLHYSSFFPTLHTLIISHLSLIIKPSSPPHTTNTLHLIHQFHPSLRLSLLSCIRSTLAHYTSTALTSPSSLPSFFLSLVCQVLSPASVSSLLISPEYTSSLREALTSTFAILLHYITLSTSSPPSRSSPTPSPLHPRHSTLTDWVVSVRDFLSTSLTPYSDTLGSSSTTLPSPSPALAILSLLLQASPSFALSLIMTHSAKNDHNQGKGENSTGKANGKKAPKPSPQSSSNPQDSKVDTPSNDDGESVEQAIPPLLHALMLLAGSPKRAVTQHQSDHTTLNSMNPDKDNDSDDVNAISQLTAIQCLALCSSDTTVRALLSQSSSLRRAFLRISRISTDSWRLNLSNSSMPTTTSRSAKGNDINPIDDSDDDGSDDDGDVSYLATHDQLSSPLPPALELLPLYASVAVGRMLRSDRRMYPALVRSLVATLTLHLFNTLTTTISSSPNPTLVMAPASVQRLSHVRLIMEAFMYIMSHITGKQAMMDPIVFTLNPSLLTAPTGANALSSNTSSALSSPHVTLRPYQLLLALASPSPRPPQRSSAPSSSKPHGASSSRESYPSEEQSSSLYPVSVWLCDRSLRFALLQCLSHLVTSKQLLEREQSMMSGETNVSQLKKAAKYQMNQSTQQPRVCRQCRSAAKSPSQQKGTSSPTAQTQPHDHSTSGQCKACKLLNETDETELCGDDVDIKPILNHLINAGDSNHGNLGTGGSGGNASQGQRVMLPSALTGQSLIGVMNMVHGLYEKNYTLTQYVDKEDDNNSENASTTTKSSVCETSNVTDQRSDTETYVMPMKGEPCKASSSPNDPTATSTSSSQPTTTTSSVAIALVRLLISVCSLPHDNKVTWGRLLQGNILKLIVDVCSLCKEVNKATKEKKAKAQREVESNENSSNSSSTETKENQVDSDVLFTAQQELLAVAASRLLIHINPQLVSESSILGILPLLTTAARNASHELHEFELLMAMTNIASQGIFLSDKPVTQAPPPTSKPSSAVTQEQEGSVQAMWACAKEAVLSRNEQVQKCGVELFANLSCTQYALSLIATGRGETELRMLFAFAQSPEVPQAQTAALGALAMMCGAHESIAKIIANFMIPRGDQSTNEDLNDIKEDDMKVESSKGDVSPKTSPKEASGFNGKTLLRALLLHPESSEAVRQRCSYALKCIDAASTSNI